MNVRRESQWTLKSARRWRSSTSWGLHARAAAKLIELASGFESRIRIYRDGREADAKSIMRVMMLAAPKGTSIEVVAQGGDAAEAVEAIERLVAGRFDEAE